MSIVLGLMPYRLTEMRYERLVAAAPINHQLDLYLREVFDVHTLLQSQVLEPTPVFQRATTVRVAYDSISFRLPVCVHWTCPKSQAPRLLRPSPSSPRNITG